MMFILRRADHFMARDEAQYLIDHPRSRSERPRIGKWILAHYRLVIAVDAWVVACSTGGQRAYDDALAAVHDAMVEARKAVSVNTDEP